MKILTLSLNIPLHPTDIACFRGSIVEVVGKEQNLFHNHDNSQEQDHFHWGYPLIQYGSRSGLAHITGIGEGADALQQSLLPKLPEQLTVKGETHSLDRIEIRREQHEWNIELPNQEYGLFSWLALNQTNYKAWSKCENEQEQIVLLERALTGHLRVIGKRVGISHLNLIEGHILELADPRMIHVFGTKLVKFHIRFKSSLILPYGVGLGRSAAFGFGEIMSVHRWQYLRQKQSKWGSLEAIV